MKPNKSLIDGFTNIAVFAAVFIASLNVPRDPDLGWHLKNGEYFFQHGSILRDNIFSTMMADYKWVNHSWASDLITYFFYNYFGFIGLTFLGALVVTLTFYFFSKAFSLSTWNKAIIFPIIFYFVDPVNTHSFRSQMLSYLFTGVLFYILHLGFDKNKKFLLLAIPLFLAWANLHGGFVLGLALMAIYMTIRVGKEAIDKRGAVKELFVKFRFHAGVSLLAFLATLASPFGVLVYKEAFNHFRNPWLKYVAEWAPFTDLSLQWWHLIIFINLFFLGTLFLYFSNRENKRLPIFLICAILFALSFDERRYAWTLYYASMPIIMGVSDFFKPNSKRYQEVGAFVISLIFLFVASAVKGNPRVYTSMNWQNYCQASFILCSPKALEFLESNKLTTNLSTPYSWGGWMIWNYPNVKPSIDGRMHLWKDEKGYSAFAEYYTNVQDWESIDKSRYDVVLALKIKPIYKRLTKLSKEGKWRTVYTDYSSAIFIRN